MLKLSLVATAALAAPMGDLERAKAKVPRAEFRNPIPANMAETLNNHLTNSHPNTKPCHEWSVADLQEVQAEMFKHRVTQHDEVYQNAKDTRSMRFQTLEEHQAHWGRMNEHGKTHELVEEMQRDGHCMEAVMWWTHHLSFQKKQTLKHVVVPELPLQRWREPVTEEGKPAEEMYRAHYNPSSTCLACHGGGVPWQDPDVQPPPLPRQVNGMDRQRRCEEWYGADEGGACGPCDGIAGAYWGDMPDEGIYPACKVVAGPEDVPVEQRANNRWPKSFSVEMRGADRWPRASASRNSSCNFTTDCSEACPLGSLGECEGEPIPPSVPLHWYAAIRGVLFLDHNPGLYGGGRLRHETVYHFPSGEEGAKMALNHQNGHDNIHLTEIHVQTPEMASADPVQPGVMLNLEHKTMSALNSSGVDDSKLDWRRIPTPDWGPGLPDDTCVCVQNPAGLPYFEGAYANATYKGRISFIPPWQKTGVGGPSDGTPIVADHWVKWTFHLFVDIETGLPAMFSSPYGGCATYGNWTLTPDALWPADVNGGWRNNPGREVCYDVTSSPACKPYTNQGN